MSTPTPGPWIADGYDLRQKHGRMIAYFGPHHTPADEYPMSCRLQDEANAQWVAAAPAALADAKAEAAHYMSVAQKATDDLTRLRADNLTAHQMACAVGLERDQLRAEVERLTKQIKDDNRAYCCELRDPNGTIWEQAAKDHARAERAEAEIATERARLDYLALNMGTPRVADALNCDYSRCFPIRDAVDAAMKP